MERSPIAALARGEQSEALVAGFVATVRVLKRMIFIIVQDRTGRLQVTIDRAPAGEAPHAIEQQALDLTTGSAVKVRGKVVVNPAVKIGGVELLATSLETVGKAEPGLPVDEHSARLFAFVPDLVPKEEKVKKEIQRKRKHVFFAAGGLLLCLLAAYGLIQS